MKSSFDKKKHLGYFSHCLRHLPEGYSKLDSNRLTLVHFAVHALDILGVWDDVHQQEELQLDKTSVIDWIASLQVKTRPGVNNAGFRGSTYLGVSGSNTHEYPCDYTESHVAMTYTALLSLTALRVDLSSHVDTQNIIQSLVELQTDDGSFRCTVSGSENDMRFLYCACAISHMLADWRGVDIDRAVDYIRSCRAFDGAIGLLPGQEGHGGSTFCAIASLVLMKRLDVLDAEWKKELIHWCVSRQVGGMQGRPNKLEDTCYSYWIGGTLRLLGCDNFLCHEKLGDFVIRNQTPFGGFSKQIGAHPDLLHAYYSLSYLAMNQESLVDLKLNLKDYDCTLGVSMDTARHFDG